MRSFAAWNADRVHAGSGTQRRLAPPGGQLGIRTIGKRQTQRVLHPNAIQRYGLTRKHPRKWNLS